jgi:hypothetical protein
MMAKGVLKEGEHFFHVGRRTVLKRDSIVCFIEHREHDETTEDTAQAWRLRRWLIEEVEAAGKAVGQSLRAAGDQGSIENSDT